MRRNLARTIESLVLVLLVMPVGMLLADTMFQSPAATSSRANWYDVEQASNMLRQMKDLSMNARREVARLQVQGRQLAWESQAIRLSQARADIDTIGHDLGQLNQMRDRLEPWQQSLVYKVTPEVHEMVYQMDAALKALNVHEDRAALALSEYPQNIDMIYQNSNRMAGTIGTVTEYAHAEERMAKLRQKTNTANS